MTFLPLLLACSEPAAPPPEAPPVEDKERTTKPKGKRKAKRPSQDPDEEGLAALLDARAPLSQADPACNEVGLDPDTRIGTFARDLHDSARRVESDCRATQGGLTCKVTIHGVYYSELTFDVRDGALVGKSLKCVFAG